MIELITPAETATRFNEIGIGGHFTPQRFANLRSAGGGPPFRKVGKKVFYVPGEAIEWLWSLVSPPLKSAAEYKNICPAKERGSGDVRVPLATPDRRSKPIRSTGERNGGRPAPDP